jgi:hypothetical protein
MTAGLGAVLLLALTGACGRDNYYIVYEHTELRGTERISAGGGCNLVLERGLLGGGSSSGSLASVDGDLSVDEQNQPEGYRVVVSSEGEELVRRDYDRAFLLSHDVDVFEFTTHAGKHFEFMYRGSTDCDLPPPTNTADAGATTP